jgi:uncharacterized repeat protein (TIGR03803 family)
MRISPAAARLFATLVFVAAIGAPGFSEVPQARLPFNVHHSFPSQGASMPTAPLLWASDGYFYGTTGSGGAANRGTVFKITPDGELSVLHSFRGNGGGDPDDGANPSAGLIEGADGSFYGTARIGGRFADGTIFRMSRDGTVTTLHHFGDGNDGVQPFAELVQASDGNFYGTTFSGTVFRMTPDGTVTTLHRFDPLGQDGQIPIAALIQATDGSLYGTAYNGGVPGLGTIFKITLDGTFTRLHTFTGPDGGYPSAALIQATDGNFYGTTEGGQSLSTFGTVFKMTPDGTVAVLYTFRGEDGATPRAALRQAADGSFYGTTAEGGPSGKGTLFRITPDGTLTTLHAFGRDHDGANPGAELVEASDGTFYGTTVLGGSPLERGSVFKATRDGEVRILQAFEADPDGSAPAGALIRAADGSLYGTTAGGGDFGHGSVFRVRVGSESILTTVHSFTGGAGGAVPAGGVIQVSDGSFYGTTLLGGCANRGTAFKIGPDGAMTVLHAFTGGDDGAFPSGALAQAGDGTIYGTTLAGGRGRRGTVFQLTPGGTVAVLHSFSGRIDGATPAAGLVQASDGNLYGTTLAGGPFNLGTIFRLTPAGSLARLHAFRGGGDGALPSAALIQATDGSFYGTTLAGGLGGFGTVFRMTPAGSVSVLHAFRAGADGASPNAALLEGADGQFYGTTLGGGTANRGTIFKINSSGVLISLHAFSGADGAYPNSSLTRFSADQLFGTTLGGGNTVPMRGTLYRLWALACEDALTLSYSDGTLYMGFTLMTEFPTVWSAWLVTSQETRILWSIPIPSVSQSTSFVVPIPGFPRIGRVAVATTVSTSFLGTLCADAKTIDTR